MKKQWIAALCAWGLLTAGQTVSAEEIQKAVADAVPAVEMSAEEKAEKDVLMTVVTDHPVSFDAFLDDISFSKNVNFAAFHRPDTGELAPVGQLQMKKGGRDMVAEVLTVSSRDKRLDPYLAKIFESDKNGNVTENVVKALADFNQKLSAMPLATNAGILKAVGELREMTGQEIPFSIAYTDFRTVESLHLLRTPERIATTGVRLFAYVDGWVFPVYVKGYVWKPNQEEYRFLFALMADNEKEELKQAADNLALAASKVH